MMITKVPGALVECSLQLTAEGIAGPRISPSQAMVRGSSVPNGQPARLRYTAKIERFSAPINPSNPIFTDVRSTNGARSGVRAWRPPV